MNRYIEQLIGDIRNATLNIRPPHEIWFSSEADPDDEVELDDISYIEQFVEGIEEPIESITGIDAISLPPPEKLTNDQKALLSVELEKLLEIFHFILDFPENYPLHLRYPFIFRFWRERQVALSFGESHIELCDYNEENCPFFGYCHICEEVQKEKEAHPAVSCSYDDDILDIDDLLPTNEQLNQLRRRNNPDLPF
ncbi:MAG: hypothetical protein JXA72_08795 [Bacteroidales bacterium]|nr:hypothetical protein [Bacteroidales bacterium]